MRSLLTLPADASNVDVRDQFGRALVTDLSLLQQTICYLANATLDYIFNHRTINLLSAQYNLPGATLQGANMF